MKCILLLKIGIFNSDLNFTKTQKHAFWLSNGILPNTEYAAFFIRNSYRKKQKKIFLHHMKFIWTWSQQKNVTFYLHSKRAKNPIILFSDLKYFIKENISNIFSIVLSICNNKCKIKITKINFKFNFTYYHKHVSFPISKH